MSEKRLRNIAVWYCERYLVSSGKLTDHLNKRLYRDVRYFQIVEGTTEIQHRILAKAVGL